MKIALVAPRSQPPIEGGAENLWNGLINSLSSLYGVNVTFINPPSFESNLLELLKSYKQFSELDLKEFDRVITTKYPAWACAHDKHVLYMQHTLRGLYDTYPHNLACWLDRKQVRSLFLATRNLETQTFVATSLLRALELASAPTWQLETRSRAVTLVEHAFYSKTEFLDENLVTRQPITNLISKLISLVGRLSEAGEVWVTSFPGPFARACIRLLDAVALSPKRISSYFAISDQVANRLDYFPEKISIQVLYHPTALNFQSFFDVTCAQKGKSKKSLAVKEKQKKSFVLVPGRLESIKRVDLIMRAYKASGIKIPLWVVGKGSQEEKLSKLASEIPGVVMKGFLTPEDLVRAYKTAEFVVFAPYQEDYGLVTVEAFAAKTPVLTCVDAGGPLELVSHKQSGFLSEPNVEGLADGFKYLMSLTPIQRREFGDRGHDWVMANLSWSNVAHSLSSIGKEERRNQRSKLLVFNTFPLEPVTSGGRKRILGLYTRLADQFNVELISLSINDDCPVYRKHASNFLELRLPVGDALRNLAAYYQKRLGFSCFDLIVAQYPELLSHVLPWLKESLSRTNIIIFSHPYMYSVYKHLAEQEPWLKKSDKENIIVYEAHNVEVDLKRTMLPDNQLGRRFLCALTVLEKELVQRAQLVTACSHEDAIVFRSLLNSKESESIVIPNGLDFSQVEYQKWNTRLNRAKQRGFAVALFIGSSHFPNLDAARVIIETAKTLSNWHFVLLGDCGMTVLEEYSTKGGVTHNVHCLGPVSEYEKKLWLTQATVGLNPLVSGSGTNLKVIEYAACGLIIISTAVGVRGWGWIPGQHFIKVEPNTQSLKNGLQEVDKFVAHNAIHINSIAGMKNSSATPWQMQVQQLGWKRLATNFSIALKRILR